VDSGGRGAIGLSEVERPLLLGAKQTFRKVTFALNG
jgi:hypothetical protein